MPPSTPPEHERLRLLSDELEVVVLPRKGADLYALVDRASGIDVLFKSPWGWRDPDTLPPTGDSQQDWLARYPGGWQQLLPHAGPERRVRGVLRGYHGEAATRPWRVQARTSSSAVLATRLPDAVLSLTRTLSLEGPALTICDTVRNDTCEPTEVMWVQHPAFGAPFIDGSCRLDFGARTLLSDAEAPGTALVRDRAYDLTPGAGTCADLRAVPGRDSASATFGALTDFCGSWFSIDSPNAGFGIRVEWDPNVFPHAWFWQECHASSGPPWFREAYVVAIEPANVLPGDPSPGCADRGRAPVLGPGQSWVSRIHVIRSNLLTGRGGAG